MIHHVHICKYDKSLIPFDRWERTELYTFTCIFAELDINYVLNPYIISVELLSMEAPF